MTETTDHAALIAARLRAQKADDARIAIAIRLATSLGAMLEERKLWYPQNGQSTVRVYERV